MRTHVKSHGKDLTHEELQNCISEVSITDTTEEDISTQMTINSALTFNPVSKAKPGRKGIPQTMTLVTTHHQIQSPVTENLPDTKHFHHDLSMRQASAEITPQSHQSNLTVNPPGLVPLHMGPMSQSPNPIQQSVGVPNQAHVQFGGSVDEHESSSVQQVHMLPQHDHRRHLLQGGNPYL